jgi:hypothetical protein
MSNRFGMALVVAIRIPSSPTLIMLISKVFPVDLGDQLALFAAPRS